MAGRAGSHLLRGPGSSWFEAIFRNQVVEQQKSVSKSGRRFKSWVRVITSLFKVDALITTLWVVTGGCSMLTRTCHGNVEFPPMALGCKWGHEHDLNVHWVGNQWLGHWGRESVLVNHFSPLCTTSKATHTMLTGQWIFNLASLMPNLVPNMLLWNKQRQAVKLMVVYPCTMACNATELD